MTDEKIIARYDVLMKAYKICGFALLFAGTLFLLPNIGMLFKAIGGIVVLLAIYLLTLDITLEIGPQDMVKTITRFNFFKSIHSESIDQYKCLELSTKSNYNGDSGGATSTIYYSFTFLPIDENTFRTIDISMYIESFNKSNMVKCLALAESISKITKLPIIYSESFALEMQRYKEPSLQVNNNRYYNLFIIFLVMLFLLYMFREKLF